MTFCAVKGITRCFCFVLALAAAFSCLPTVSAATSAIVSVEAFTVGGGFISYPTEIAVKMGDTGVTVVESVLGRSNINKGNGVGTASITSIAMEDTDYCSIDGDIGGILDDAETEYEDEVVTKGWIANNDFAKGSSWVFILNNKISATSLANYVPQNGDVIRISYSILGNGSDLALSSDVFPATNRDQLYKYFSVLGEEDFIDAENIAMDLTATQTEINEMVAFLANEYAEKTAVRTSTATGADKKSTPPLTTKGEISRPPSKGEADPAPTGVTFTYPMIFGGISLLALIVATKKAAKK